MATRLKTVKYAFPMLASLTDATLTNLTQITAYIPESSLTFRSAFIEFDTQDIITATGGTITEWRVGFRLGAAGYTTVTELNDASNSGENMSASFIVDVTSHFTTNWSGTSMTADCQVYVDQSTGTTLGQRNVTAVLNVTYEYDDTASTHIKTVAIPLDSSTTALATGALTEIGTNQVPNLDSFLPETSKVYRDIFFVIEGNESSGASAVDRTLEASLDAEAASAFGATEKALATDRFVRFVWRRTDMTTNATHQFKLRSNATAGFNHITIMLYVTYEFDSTSTSAMVSVEMPFEIESPMGGTTSGDASKTTRDLWIEEDATITIAQSAMLLHYNTAAPVAGLNIRTNNDGATTQAYQAYTDNTNMAGGGVQLMRRFDSAVTLARGRNTIAIEAYRTDATDLAYNVSGLLIINYTCTVPAGGHGAINHTVKKLIIPSNGAAASTARLSSSASLMTIPETDWFANSVGAVGTIFKTSTGTLGGINIITERGSGGWFGLYADVVSTDAEAGVSRIHCAFRSDFLRWTGDVGADRSNPENARLWRITSSAVAFYALVGMMTYHSITFTAADSVTGFTGTVNIDLHRASSGEKVLSTSRTGDGAFSFTWFDDTESLFVVADDGTNVGRSEDTLAS